MGKKLLILCRSMPPASTGSSIIVENLIRFFDHSQISVIGQKTTVEYNDRMKGLPQIKYLDTHIGIFGRGYRYLKWLKFPLILKEAIQKAKEDKVSCILSVFPDEFYLYLGYKVSKALNIPYYTWFHNTYLDNTKGLRKPIAKYIQPKVFAHAQMNFVMSDGILNEFKKRYQNVKFKTLVHGFKIPKIELSFKAQKDNSTKFVFTGSLNKSNEDATLRLFNCILEKPDHEIHIYSGNAKSFLKERNIINDRLIYHGFVTLEQLQIELLDYDVVLLPHGFHGGAADIEFKTIFPTRTIPLLYSSRPILAHSPPDVFLTEFLEKNNCAYLIKTKDVKSISLEIEGFKRNKQLQKTITENALKTADIFDVQRLIQMIKNETSI